MGIVSKGEARTLTLNTGLSKGSNAYRQRNNYSTWFGHNRPKHDSGNAKWKERVVASLLFRKHTSPEEMRKKNPM